MGFKPEKIHCLSCQYKCESSDNCSLNECMYGDDTDCNIWCHENLDCRCCDGCPFGEM